MFLLLHKKIAHPMRAFLDLQSFVCALNGKDITME